MILDECGSDKRIGNRVYRYALPSVRARIQRFLAHCKRVFILLVYIIDRYIITYTFEGSYLADIYRDFVVNQVIPLYNPWPAPQSIIMMDNASIYYTH